MFHQAMKNSVRYMYSCFYLTNAGNGSGLFGWFYFVCKSKRETTPARYISQRRQDS